MTRQTFVGLAVVMVALGAAVRLHDALGFPVLASYDGYAHFTYVWYLAVTRHVPLPTSGWEFFQPPLYYAFMAALWSAFAGIDPVARLRIGIALVALAGLVHAAVVWAVVRRRDPDDRLLALITLAFMLFLPVHLYSAAFLGNEGLTAVLCSVAFWILLAHLERPTVGRSLALGVVLGLAMLTKITAIAVVAGAFLAIGLAGRRSRSRAGLHVALASLALLVVCGWYYARNVEHYGTPFVMSRRELMLRLVEDSQPQASRGVADYVLFDPMIFRRPMWPRPAADPAHDTAWGRALRDSVWTGLYANTWFDGFGGVAVPRITENELARRAGQALLVLGIVPTLLVLFGIGAAIAALRRRGFDGMLVATLGMLGAMLAIFIVGTRAVPIAAAVKATYFLPISVPFGIAFGLGLERVKRVPFALPAVAVIVALFSALAVAVFWHGLLFDERARQGAFPMIAESEANQTGVVYYAGGEPEKARELFARAARGGLYLGWENLAVLALDDGRPDEAIHQLKRALGAQPRQSFGNAADRALYDRGTRAEYLNLLAVAEHMRGDFARARRAAAAALRDDATLPEAHYDFAVTLVEEASESAAGRGVLLALARQHLARALALDPGFAEARALSATATDCAGSTGGTVTWTRSLPGTRRYPVETGPGASHAAAIGRRRHIEPRADQLRALCAPDRQLQT